jgi:peptidoglycan/xylan/chitin deacetylase (PgdA/CDA1 family)
VLLTFDDGPHPEGTPAVLEVLREFSARAIFFVVGSRVPRAPEMLRRVLDEGHLLGNHSFAHPLERQLGLLECRRDLERCQKVIEERTGVRPTMFRPPLGHISIASMVAPRLSGLTPMLWSVDSDDWRLRHTSEVPAAAARLLQQFPARALREIVLFHDERTFTADLLRMVLPELVARGVSFRPKRVFGNDRYVGKV